MSYLMSATLFFNNPQKNWKGFGCLVPRQMGVRSFGVLMNSYIFKDRDKTYNETWMIGGAAQEDLLSLPDQDHSWLINVFRARALNHDFVVAQDLPGMTKERQVVGLDSLKGWVSENYNLDFDLRPNSHRKVRAVAHRLSHTHAPRRTPAAQSSEASPPARRRPRPST